MLSLNRSRGETACDMRGLWMPLANRVSTICNKFPCFCPSLLPSPYKYRKEKHHETPFSPSMDFGCPVHHGNDHFNCNNPRFVWRGVSQRTRCPTDNCCKISRRLVRFLQKDGDHLHRFAKQVRWKACTLCHPRFYKPNHSLPVGIARLSTWNG